MGKGLFCHNTGIVYKEFCRKIIRSIENKIVILYNIQDIIAVDKLMIGINSNIRIDRKHGFLRGGNLRLSDIRRRMDYLTL